MSIEELTKKDNTFTENGFLSKVNNTFIILLSSIMNGEIDNVKHKISKELYEELKKYVEYLNRNKYVQIFDELNIRRANIKDIIEQEDYYLIKTLIISRFLNKIIDKNTKEIIDNANYKIVTLEITFKKNKNVKKELIIKKCSHCGASLNISSTGICPYCKNAYDTYNYDWILTNIEKQSKTQFLWM